MWTHEEAPQLNYNKETKKIHVKTYEGKESVSKEMKEEEAKKFLKSKEIDNYTMIKVIEDGNKLELGDREAKRWIKELS